VLRARPPSAATAWCGGRRTGWDAGPPIRRRSPVRQACTWSPRPGCTRPSTRSRARSDGWARVRPSRSSPNSPTARATSGVPAGLIEVAAGFHSLDVLDLLCGEPGASGAGDSRASEPLPRPSGPRRRRVRGSAAPGRRHDHHRRRAVGERQAGDAASAAPSAAAVRGRRGRGPGDPDPHRETRCGPSPRTGRRATRGGGAGAVRPRRCPPVAAASPPPRAPRGPGGR
jgi:hypothetical protein